MNTLVFFLFAITSNVHTGEEISRVIISPPLDEETCLSQEEANGMQRPSGNVITIKKCMTLPPEEKAK